MQNDTGNDSSYFGNPVAIAICLSLCVIAAIMGSTKIALFLGFVFVLVLAAYLWAKFALVNLSYSIKIENQHIYPGQKFTLKRIIKNEKFLPLVWLEINEKCDIADCAMPKEEFIVKGEDLVDDKPIETYIRKYTLSSIKWFQKVSFRDVWEAKKRGIIQIEGSSIKSGDGFGLCAKKKEFKFEKPYRITVFPELVDVSVGKIINDIWDSRSAAKGYLQDKTIIKSIRDYLPGDSAKDINMRILARGGIVKSNVYEIVTPDSVLFILDNNSFEGIAAAEYEETLSILASLIDGLMIQGIAVSLMTQASDWFPEGVTETSCSEYAKYIMLEKLAASSASDQSFSDSIAIDSTESLHVYYVASSIKNSSSLHLLEDFPEHKVRFLTLQDCDPSSHFGSISGINMMSMRRTS